MHDMRCSARRVQSNKGQEEANREEKVHHSRPKKAIRELEQAEEGSEAGNDTCLSQGPSARDCSEICMRCQLDRS